MGKYIHKFNTQQEFNNATTNTTYSPESGFEELINGEITYGLEVFNVSPSQTTYSIENKNYIVNEAWDAPVTSDEETQYLSVLYENSLGISFVYADTTPIGWGTTERQLCIELLKKISDAINFEAPVSLSEVIQKTYLNPNEINEQNDLFNVCSQSTRCNCGYLLNFGVGDAASVLVIMSDDDLLRIVEYDDLFWTNGGKSFSSILQETNFWISQLEVNTQYLYTKPFVAKLQSDLYYNDFEYRFKLFYDPTKDRIGFYDDLNKQKYVTVNSNESEGIYHENPLLANVLFAPANENIVSNSTIFKFNGSNIPLASHFNNGVCCFGITKQNDIVYFQNISCNGEDIRIPSELETGTIVATCTNGQWTSQNYKKFITIRRYETLA